MATYVLIPGAASGPWYWHRVTPLLEARGHEVITPDLPVEDDAAGFDVYAHVVEESIGNRGGASPTMLVAQSMGAYTAGLVADRVPVDLVVLVAAMTPAPDESGGEWWERSGQFEAYRADADRAGRTVDGEFDPLEVFLHDVPEDIVAASAEHVRAQSGRPFEDPWPLDGWPAVPTRFLLMRDDRLFPAEFQRRVVPERLGITPDEMDGGHLPALARPGALVDYLERVRVEELGE